MAKPATAIVEETTEEKIQRLKASYTDGDWTRYRCSMFFITPLCASVPGSEDLVKKWLETRKPRAMPAGGRSLDEVAQEVMETLPKEEEQEEVSVLVFQEKDGGLVVRGATLRAHIKDCASVISSYSGRLQGEKSFAVKAKNAIYLDWLEHTFVPILRHDGTPVTKDDGERTKLVHAKTPRGPISAFKVFREIKDARLDFELMVLGRDKPWIDEKDLRRIFEYGGKHGYGGERSEDGGKYVFELQRIGV